MSAPLSLPATLVPVSAEGPRVTIQPAEKKAPVIMKFADTYATTTAGLTWTAATRRNSRHRRAWTEYARTAGAFDIPYAPPVSKVPFEEASAWSTHIQDAWAERSGTSLITTMFQNAYAIVVDVSTILQYIEIIVDAVYHLVVGPTTYDTAGTYVGFPTVNPGLAKVHKVNQASHYGSTAMPSWLYAFIGNNVPAFKDSADNYWALAHGREKAASSGVGESDTRAAGLRFINVQYGGLVPAAFLNVGNIWGNAFMEASASHTVVTDLYNWFDVSGDSDYYEPLQASKVGVPMSTALVPTVNEWNSLESNTVPAGLAVGVTTNAYPSSAAVHFEAIVSYADQGSSQLCVIVPHSTAVAEYGAFDLCPICVFAPVMFDCKFNLSNSIVDYTATPRSVWLDSSSTADGFSYHKVTGEISLEYLGTDQDSDELHERPTPVVPVPCPEVGGRSAPPARPIPGIAAVSMDDSVDPNFKGFSASQVRAMLKAASSRSVPPEAS